MESKKSPKADLTKNSKFYFAIGLCLVLFLSWKLMEWKTYDKSMYEYEALGVEQDDDELVPLTEQIKTPHHHPHLHLLLKLYKL